MWVGQLRWKVRLTAVNSRFVHAYLQLARPGDGRADSTATVVILKEGVEVVVVIVLGTAGSFDQRVYHNNQHDQDPRGEDAGTRDAGLYLKYKEHED